jgi:hypothetical protein
MRRNADLLGRSSNEASGEKRLCNRRDRSRRERHVQADKQYPDVLQTGEAVARLRPVAVAGVQHAGRNTEDYPADEVQAMAQHIASELARPSGRFKTRKRPNSKHCAVTQLAAMTM